MKKGISPLIATVLLVGFAIALAAIVSNYVIKEVKEFKPEVIIEDSLLCDEVSLGFQITEGNVLNCVSADGSFSIYKFQNLELKNKGSFTVRKVQVTSPGLGTGAQHDIDDLNPGDLTSDYEIGFKISDDKIIKITPIVENPETKEIVLCTKSQLIINYEKLCKDLGRPDDGVCSCLLSPP